MSATGPDPLGRPGRLVALFMPFPTIVWVVLFFLVVQQVENNVLAPRISGHAVGLHPLTRCSPFWRASN